jgi:hypothetical protein
VVNEFCPNLTERQAKNIIKTWIKNEMLVTRDYEDPKDRHPHPSLFVAKRPGNIWSA